MTTWRPPKNMTQGTTADPARSRTTEADTSPRHLDSRQVRRVLNLISDTLDRGVVDADTTAVDGNAPEKREPNRHERRRQAAGVARPKRTVRHRYQARFK